MPRGAPLGSPEPPVSVGLGRDARPGSGFVVTWLAVITGLGLRKPTSSWPALGVSNLQRPFFVDFWAPGGKKNITQNKYHLSD